MVNQRSAKAVVMAMMASTITSSTRCKPDLDYHWYWLLQACNNLYRQIWMSKLSRGGQWTPPHISWASIFCSSFHHSRRWRDEKWSFLYNSKTGLTILTFDFVGLTGGFQVCMLFSHFRSLNYFDHFRDGVSFLKIGSDKCNFTN